MESWFRPAMMRRCWRSCKVWPRTRIAPGGLGKQAADGSSRARSRGAPTWPLSSRCLKNSSATAHRTPGSAAGSADYDRWVTTLRADQDDLRETGAYYDAFAEVAEDRYTSNHVLVRVREGFRRAVEPHAAISVLDLGCG